MQCNVRKPHTKYCSLVELGNRTRKKDEIEETENKGEMVEIRETGVSEETERGLFGGFRPSGKDAVKN